MSSKLNTRASMLLTQPSDNPHGMKFYQAALVWDPPTDRHWVVLNWGAGRGIAGEPMGMGQHEVHSFWDEGTAYSFYQRKIKSKMSTGYDSQTYAYDIVDPKLEAKLFNEPYAKPAQKKPTFNIDVVATLVSTPMTPNLVGRLIDQREKLVTLREKQQAQLDATAHKIDLINHKLASGE